MPNSALLGIAGDRRFRDVGANTSRLWAKDGIAPQYGGMGDGIIAVATNTTLKLAASASSDAA